MQDILGNVVAHTGSGSPSEVDAALDVLVSSDSLLQKCCPYKERKSFEVKIVPWFFKVLLGKGRGFFVTNRYAIYFNDSITFYRWH